MEERTLYLKNMICSRCITVVRYELDQMGIDIIHIDLTKMKIRFNQEVNSIHQIKKALEKHGLGIIQDKEERTVAHIKQLLRTLIEDCLQSKLNKKNSDFLSGQIGLNYNHLSRLFKKHEHITIEKYVILLKTEKVKELLEYGEHSLAEISETLGYSSTQHLSKQFKLITGVSISDYKKFLQAQRVSPDKF